MIEKITEDKYLFNGHIVSKTYLQDLVTKQQSLMDAIQLQLDQVSFLETDNLEGSILEAVELYNERNKSLKAQLQNDVDALEISINQISSCCESI